VGGGSAAGELAELVGHPVDARQPGPGDAAQEGSQLVALGWGQLLAGSVSGAPASRSGGCVVIVSSLVIVQNMVGTCERVTLRTNPY
jgi:hypothetical protein